MADAASALLLPSSLAAEVFDGEFSAEARGLMADASGSFSEIPACSQDTRITEELQILLQAKHEELLERLDQRLEFATWPLPFKDLFTSKGWPWWVVRDD